jgi:hypothetical protein
MSLSETRDQRLLLQLSGEYGMMFSSMTRHQVTRLRDALNDWLEKGEFHAEDDQ